MRESIRLLCATGAEYVTLRDLTTVLGSYVSYRTALSIGAALVGVGQALTWSQIRVMEMHMTCNEATMRADMKQFQGEIKAELDSHKADIRGMVSEVTGDILKLQLRQDDLQRGLSRVEADTAAIRKDIATLLHREHL